ncbi:MAK10-like protein [Tanacetum coccineum]
MGDENPIRTLGYYSKPSHEGYRNTIELPAGNNVDFLKLVDSLDLNGENRERTRLRLFQFSLRDQASNWLERLPAGSISTWEDLTTRFLAQFFPPGRTAKLHNDIPMFQQHHGESPMFQQHHGESLSEAWTRFKDLLQKVPHHGIDLWLQGREFCGEERSNHVRERPRLYDNESWNDPRDFAKSDKVFTLPQDVPSTSDRHLIELEIKIQMLENSMEKQAFVEYASLRTDEAGEVLVSEFMASQDARLSMFEADFKGQQGEMTNKIDTVLKVITDQVAGTLPSDTVKNPKLGTHPVSSARSYPIIDP